MRNIRLIVAYDGTDFHGWQRQPNLPTIQALIEAAIERITGQPAVLHGSGRTDAGVHAANQVANFTTDCKIPLSNLLKALNDHLPRTVRIKRADEAAESFHARYDARSKTYRYRILLAPIASPFVARFVYHYPYPIEREPMEAAARWLEGEHDFTSFAGSEGAVGDSRLLDASGDTGASEAEASSPHSLFPTPHSRSMVRTIFSSRILWRPRTSILVYEVKGSGFLHHMVRNIVGTLLEVGRGKLTTADIPEILAARDRSRAGPTAPASGLTLVRVEY